MDLSWNARIVSPGPGAVNTPGTPENRGNTEILCLFTVLKIETPEEPEVWTLYYI